jgi:hypothetical protein
MYQMARRGKWVSYACRFFIHFLISRPRKLPTEELANESRSTHITVAADMVFSLSHYLSGVRTYCLLLAQYAELGR